MLALKHMLGQLDDAHEMLNYRSMATERLEMFYNKTITDPFQLNYQVFLV